MTKGSAFHPEGFQEEFSKQKEKFRRLLKETLAHADEKNVHQLRVSTRRLRAAIDLARANGVDGEPERKTLKQLKKLGKILGERREVDVLERDVRALGLPFAGKKPGKKKLRKKLEKEKKLARALEKVEEHVQAEGPRPFDGIVADLSAKVARLEAGKFVDPKELHVLRIEVKKIRYAFEMMGLPVAPLKKLQAILGELHDAEVLAGYLKRRREDVALAVVRKEQRRREQAARKKIKPVLASARRLLEPLKSQMH